MPDHDTILFPSSPEETWVAIPGYDGVYEVGDQGNVRKAVSDRWTDAGHLIRKRLTKKGYVRVSLWKDGKEKRPYLHKLVAEAFIGHRPAGLQINHKDANKQNNRVSNLEYTDQLGNMKHAREHGLRPFGEKIRISKLTDEDVSFIKEFYIKGCRCFGAKPLARMFGVDNKTVRMVVKNRTWRHVLHQESSDGKEEMGTGCRDG